MSRVSPKEANQLFHALIRVQKLLLSARSALPSVRAGLDAVTYPVMFVVHQEGPLGISDVAARMHNDVSTVSRQVSMLVSHGLLEKRPDPHDGRATLVSITDYGQVALEEVQTISGLWFQRLLEDWDHLQAQTVTTDLHRLGDALDKDLQQRATTVPVLTTSNPPSTKEN